MPVARRHLVLGLAFGLGPASLALALALAACAWDLSGFTSASGPDASAPGDGSLSSGDGGDGASADGGDGGGSEGGAAAGIRFIQANADYHATKAVVSLSGVTAHDALVAFTTTDSSTVSVTASKGMNPTSVYGPVGSSGERTRVLFLGDNPAGDITWSAAKGSDGTYVLLYLAEYAGLATFDVAASNTGSNGGSDGMTATLTTTAPSELLLGYGFSGSVAGGKDFDVRSTFSQNVLEDRIVAAPGSYSATATMNQGSGWLMVAAAFR